MQRVWLLIALLTNTVAVKAQERSLNVTVDPRIELLASALMQSDWPEGRHGFLSPYARDMQQSSFAFRKHPFITEINERRGKITLAELINLALASADPTNTTPQPSDPQSLGAAYNKFAADMKFGEFFTSHQPILDELSSTLATGLPPSSQIEQLEKYYGLPHSKYELIVASTLRSPQDRGFALTPGRITGDPIRRAIITPDGLEAGRLTFKATSIRDSVFSLFGRELLTDSAANLPDKLVKHQDWWSLVRDKAEANGVDSWHGYILHSIAAAAAIRMWQKSDSPADAVRMKREQIQGGFLLVPFFQERLSEYEDHRDKYPTMSEFLPQLLATLDTLEPVLTGSGEPADLGLADVWLTDAGIPVKSVTPGSLAAKAGILKGDTVQSIAGIRINGSESYLKAWKRWEASKHGEVVPFKTIRSGKPIIIKVIMKRNLTFDGFRKKSAQ